jgi:hypothetical protein
MEQIEQALGKRIIRIETKNLDEMEEVRLPLGPKWMVTHSLRTDHEKGSEMKLLHVASPLNSIFLTYYHPRSAVLLHSHAYILIFCERPPENRPR